MMTKDFEPITEVGIHLDDFGEGTAASNRPGEKIRIDVCSCSCALYFVLQGSSSQWVGARRRLSSTAQRGNRQHRRRSRLLSSYRNMSPQSNKNVSGIVENE